MIQDWLRRRVVRSPRRASAPRVGLGVLAAIAWVGAIMGHGCARRVQSPATVDAASPVVRGALGGLELWWWVVTDSRVPAAPAQSGSIGPPDPSAATQAEPAFEIIDQKYDIDEVLAAYVQRPVPMRAEDRARWFAAGFRVVGVPVADLERIRTRLRTVGPAQRQWLGEKPDWIDAVSGPPLSGDQLVDAGFGPSALPPGTLRLLLRCWLAPDWSSTSDRGPGSVLRVELMPEHVPAHSSTPRLRPGGFEGVPIRGTPLRHLAAGLIMRDGDALLIIPGSPGAAWFADGARAATPSAATGPALPTLPTLGELMLGSGPDPRTARRACVILVLVPRVPGEFRLSAAGHP